MQYEGARKERKTRGVFAEAASCKDEKYKRKYDSFFATCSYVLQTKRSKRVLCK